MAPAPRARARPARHPLSSNLSPGRRRLGCGDRCGATHSCMDLHTRLGVTTVRGAVQGEVQGAVQGAVRVGVDGGICGRTRRNGSCQLRRGIRATCARGGARRVSGTGSGVRETRFNFQKVDIGTEEAIGLRKVLDAEPDHGRGRGSARYALEAEILVGTSRRDPRPHPRVRCRATTVRRGGNTRTARPVPDAPRAPGPRDVDRFAQSVSDPRHAAHTQPKPARTQCNAQRGSRNNTRTCKTYGMRANGIAKKTDHVALKRPSVTPSEGHSVRPRSGYRDYRP